MIRRWRRSAIWGVFCALSPSSSFGQAGGNAEGAPHRAVDLTWNAPEGCPGQAAASARLEHLLGGGPERGPVAITVDLAASNGGRFKVAIRFSALTVQSERSFEGATCERVTEAALLVIALFLHPESESPVERSADGELPSSRIVVPPPPPSPSPPAPPVVPTSPHTRDSWNPPAPRTPRRVEPAIVAFAGLRTTADVGSLPAATIGAGPVVGVGLQRLTLELQGTYFAAAIAKGPKTGMGASIGLVTATARGCFALVSGPIGASTCLGAELGQSAAQGIGVQHPRTPRELWGALLLGVVLRPQGRGLVPFLSLDLGAPLTRTSYGIDEVGTVWEQPVVFGRASVGVEFSSR